MEFPIPRCGRRFRLVSALALVLVSESLGGLRGGSKYRYRRLLGALVTTGTPYRRVTLNVGADRMQAILMQAMTRDAPSGIHDIRKLAIADMEDGDTSPVVLVLTVPSGSKKAAEQRTSSK